MRIRKDKTSWRAGGVLKRDNQHDKSFDGATGQSKKKDTKKWCKGVEGRKHDPVWLESKYSRPHALNRDGSPRDPVMEVACSICRKVFETDWGYFGRPKKGKEAMLEKWRKKLGW